jgi:hypothetical protein
VFRAVKNIAAPENPDPRRAHQPKFQRSDNKVGIRGVHPHGQHGYRALIGERGKLTHLGTFRTVEEAARAYALAKKRLEVEQLIRTKAASAPTIARSVVDLIRLSMACSREPIATDDAQQRYDYAVQVISGSISIGKGSQSATDANAAADEAVPVTQRSNVGERMIAR